MGKFALGREVYFSYIKKIKYNGIFVENETPAPGKYQLRKTMILSNSISIHPKLPILKKSNELNPGPGHYSQLNTLNNTGKYILSTVINTPGLKIKSSKQYEPSKLKIVPGPGTYDT